MPTWKEACCTGRCGKMLDVSHPVASSGIHPAGLTVTGGVVWWGMREPRVPQIMCNECAAEMEKAGEFNRQET